MNIAQAYESAWKKRWDFSGRASRSEHNFYYLAQYMIVTMLLSIPHCMYQALPMAEWFYLSFQLIVILIILVMCITLCLPLIVRRLHDIGISGWWCLLFFLLQGVTQFEVLQSIYPQSSITQLLQLLLPLVCWLCLIPFLEMKGV